MASRLVFWCSLRPIKRPISSTRSSLRYLAHHRPQWQRAEFHRASYWHALACGLPEKAEEIELDFGEDFVSEDVHGLHDCKVELSADFDVSEQVDMGDKGTNAFAVSSLTSVDDAEKIDAAAGDLQGFEMGVTEKILNSRWTKKRSRSPGVPQSLRFSIGRRKHSLEELENGALGLSRVKGLLTNVPSLGEGEEAEEGEERELDGTENIRVGSKEDEVEMKTFPDPSGFALARRYAPPETDALLRFLRVDFKFNQKIMPLYENTISSVFGSSVESVQKQADEMERLGFSRKEVNYILPFFPPLVSVDMSNVYKVCAALKDQRINWNSIRGLVKNQTHLFLQDVDQVKARLHALRDLGMSPFQMASLLRAYPLLLACPLSVDTVQTVKRLKEAGFDSQWVAKSFFHNLQRRPARIDLSADLRGMIEALKRYEVDPDFVLLTCPQFFRMSPENLTSTVRTLTGRPLYLDARDIPVLLTRVPDIICQIEDNQVLQAHLESLSRIYLSSTMAHDYILKVPAIVDPRCDVEAKASLLSELGFTEEQRVALVMGAPTLLLQHSTDEMLPRLKFLLAIAEVTPDVIATQKTTVLVSMLLTPLESLQIRYNYAKKYNESLLCASKLEELLSSSDKDFSKLCGKTLEAFYRETGKKWHQRVLKRGRVWGARERESVTDRQEDTTRKVPETREDRKVGVLETVSSAERRESQQPQGLSSKSGVKGSFLAHKQFELSEASTSKSLSFKQPAGRNDDDQNVCATQDGSSSAILPRKAVPSLGMETLVKHTKVQLVSDKARNRQKRQGAKYKMELTKMPNKALSAREKARLTSAWQHIESELAANPSNQKEGAGTEVSSSASLQYKAVASPVKRTLALKSKLKLLSPVATKKQSRKAAKRGKKEKLKELVRTALAEQPGVTGTQYPS